MSQRLNILYITLKMLAVFILTLAPPPPPLYIRVGILLTCGKHLHDRAISQIGEDWSHETNLTKPLVYYCACTKTENWFMVYGV